MILRSLSAAAVLLALPATSSSVPLDAQSESAQLVASQAEAEAQKCWRIPWTDQEFCFDKDGTSVRDINTSTE